MIKPFINRTCYYTQLFSSSWIVFDWIIALVSHFCLVYVHFLSIVLWLQRCFCFNTAPVAGVCSWGGQTEWQPMASKVWENPKS